MADREAKLRILTELVGMEAAAKVAASFDLELKKGADTAEKAAANINAAAAATDKLDSAQTEATGSARQEASALEDVGAAARESGNEAQRAGAATEAALEGATAAAGDERAALVALGDAAGQSGAEAATAMEKLAAAEREAAEEAERLEREVRGAGEAAEAAARELGEGFVNAGNSIRTSGTAIEVQRSALQSLVGEAEKAKTAFIEQGAEGKAGANATGEALLKLKAKLADVNAEIGEEILKLRQMGGTGDNAFDQISASAVTFEDIATGASAAVNAAWTSLNEKFRLTPRQLGLVGQAVELAKIEILDMAARGVAATQEQIATVQKLEAEYAKLTNRAAILTNSVKDNNVKLKETGAQVAGVAGAVQQFSSLLGPTAARFGMLAGNIGQAAGAAENLKDSFAAMDLNTLGGSASKSGLQIAALAAALAGGVAAGKKFSDQNKENVQSLDLLTDEAKKLISVNLADYFDGVNLALQGQGSAWETYLAWLTLGATGANRTGSEIRFQTAAIRDGIPEQEAAAIAAKAGAEAWKFYEQSVKGGAVGHELWRQAVAASQGDADKFIAFMREHSKEMENASKFSKLAAGSADELAQALSDLSDTLPYANGNAKALAELADRIDAAEAGTRNLSAAERERISVITEAIRKGNELTETDLRGVQALLDSARAGQDAAESLRTLTTGYIALSQAQERYNQLAAQGLDGLQKNAEAVGQALSDIGKFEVATNGSSASINKLVTELQAYIALGPAYSKETEIMATALAAVLDNTTRLEPQQRANIAAYVELAEKSGTLTVAERAYAAELANTITRGNEHLVVLKERATAERSLVNTLEMLKQQEEQLNAATQPRIDGLRAEIEVVRALREELEAKSTAGREQTEVNKYQGASADYLRMVEKKLQEELEGTLTSWTANTDAKKADAQASEAAIAKYDAQTAALGNVQTSTEKLYSVVKDGREVWTNAAKDADGVSAATLKVKTETDSLGAALDGFKARQTAVSAAMGTLQVDAEKLEGQIRKTTDAVNKLNAAAAAAGGSGQATDDMQVNPPFRTDNISGGGI